MSKISLEEKQKAILEANQEERSRTIVYTRVMGYHRPVESFNVGKTGEHKERVQFLEKHNENFEGRQQSTRAPGM